MPFYDTPSLTYDSGALYDSISPLPQPKRKIMAKVKFTLKGVPDADTIQICGRAIQLAPATQAGCIHLLHGRRNGKANKVLTGFMD